MRLRTGLIVVILALSLVGCFRYSRYSGDGLFTDNGWMNYSQRYVIDLGSIDLASEKQARSYVLNRLPHARFTVGISVTEDATVSVSGTSPSHSVSVRIVLRTSDGREVVREEGPLESWVRSFALGREEYAYLYRRGAARDVPLPGGGTTSERLAVKASGGWGSYFNSSQKESYTLSFEVLSSDLSSSIPARLTLHGWDRE
jgi:hypothetical protein